jgi:hypothetical protein
MVIDNQRAVYNSAAIALGTATVATFFIGLVGFYVVSNALTRDVSSRCGFVIASTTMRGSEYLIGKFAGNVVFLTTFIAGFMVSSMAMLIVRGEAPLQPLVFAKQYLLVVPPMIVFVSALAIVFESVPLLSGKFGDVVYFFVWSGILGAVVAMIETGHGVSVARYLDFVGLGYMLDQMKTASHTTHFSIGSSGFDPSKPTFVFDGLQLGRAWILPRLVSTVLPVFLLPIAWLSFHRFDPARVRSASDGERRSWISRLSSLFKPVTRRMVLFGGGAAWTEAMLAITAFPLSAAIVAGLAIATLATAHGSFTSGVLPIGFAAAAILAADMSTREKRSGTIGFVFAAPRLKSSFVWWKFASTILVMAIVLIAPILRIAVSSPRSLVAFAVGLVFLSALATSLGVISANPKTFIVLFLTFWYVVINDHGRTPALDVAGFYGVATIRVTLAYLLAAVVALAAAEGFHRWELRRSW